MQCFRAESELPKRRLLKISTPSHSLTTVDLLKKFYVVKIRFSLQFSDPQCTYPLRHPFTPYMKTHKAFMIPVPKSVTFLYIKSYSSMISDKICVKLIPIGQTIEFIMGRKSVVLSRFSQKNSFQVLFTIASSVTVRCIVSE